MSDMQSPAEVRRRPRPKQAEALLHALRENGRLLSELAARYGVASAALPRDDRTVGGPADVAAYLMPEMGRLEQEQLRVVLLDTKNRVLRVVLVYQGTSNCTHVRLGECFREAVRAGACAIVVVHNHPSGAPRSAQVASSTSEPGQE